MRLRTVRHHIGTALRNLFLNRLMTVASVLTVASCVFIVALFYLLAVNVNSVFTHLQDQIGIVVFVDDDVPGSDLPHLHEMITAIPNVRIVEYIAPDENIDILDDLFDPDSSLSQFFRMDTPFRRAFSIEIIDLQFHDDVVYALESMGHYGIARVRSDQDMVDILWNLTRVIQTVSMIAILILGLISIVIIINTIRITVSSRQAEIGIMKYVGATDWFIRWPFIIEGILIGLVGALIPAVVCAIGYDSVISTITNVPMLDFMYFLPGERVLFYVVPFALIIGALIGLFGSVVSIRQYLKV